MYDLVNQIYRLLPIDSIMLIEEDKINRYAKYLMKLFLAESKLQFYNDPQDTIFIKKN